MIKIKLLDVAIAYGDGVLDEVFELLDQYNEDWDFGPKDINIEWQDFEITQGYLDEAIDNYNEFVDQHNEFVNCVTELKKQGVI